MKLPIPLKIASLTLSIFACALPAMARNTGLVIDARGVPLVRSMSPKILVESGREIYGTVPANASREVMEKQSFLYSRSLEEAKAEAPGRLGANPLVIRASGARLSNVMVTEKDAALILEEEKTGGFLRNQNVVVLVGAPDIGSSPLDDDSGSSSLRESLEVRLKMAKDRREALKSGRSVEPPPVLADTTPGAMAVQTGGEAGARVYKYNQYGETDDWAQPGEPVYPGSAATGSGETAAVGIPAGQAGPGEIQLASIVRIKGNKVVLQRMEEHGAVRVNSKFRVYKSILKDTSIGWLKVTGAEGREVRARILEGEGKVRVGDYIDLNEVNTIESYIDSFKE